ncbi:hypothetical protein M378DRAFT_65232 [Amanita muscaria Koide BX008]|uniref:DUF1751-domain-containing protein n=1 Tax=Amanita muscaria (strain Koide BX008) TaxID=946122 RepID=A0A0C2T6S8_AMAMK|nr:hypothetical protein M378DRAFT_65232 [Amanita muscaria Koide BX008]
MAVLSSPLSLLLSVPPFTRAFTATTIVFSSLHGWLWWTGKAQEFAPYLLMVPGSSLFRPWTFVTAALIETSAIGFITTIIFVPASLKYLERLWGSIELVKFVVVSVTISNIITFGVNWIEYFITSNADLFLYDKYHGQLALQIALLVAFTQLIPEHQVQVMGVLKARVKTLPMAYLTISTVLCIFGFQCPWILIQFGWYVSWVYLRFYKKNPGETLGGGDTYGDRSETFSLISWFPPFLRHPLTILGNTVYSVAARLRLIPISSSSDIESNGYNPVPVNSRAEAERRRAMALKALDQRLANSSSPPNHHSTAPGPSQVSRSSSANRSDGSSSPNPSNSRTVDRKKSTSELELAESGKAILDNR